MLAEGSLEAGASAGFAARASTSSSAYAVMPAPVTAAKSQLGSWFSTLFSLKRYDAFDTSQSRGTARHTEVKGRGERLVHMAQPGMPKRHEHPLRPRVKH